MKREIIFIFFIFMILLIFGSCNSSHNVFVYIEPLDTETKFDKYFADETPDIWNNVWVHNALEEDPNAYLIYNTVIGLTKIKVENDLIIITYRLITDALLGGCIGQDKDIITIRQGEAFKNGQAPKFKCKGGITRDEAGGGSGLIDYDGVAYTFYDGLVPSVYEKEKFEAEVLSKLSEEDRQYVLSLYEHGTAPTEIEGWRFDVLFMNSLKDKKEEKDVLKAAYKKENPEEKWYKLQEGIDTNKVLEILANISTFTYIKKTYDYKKYYILKHDVVEDNREGIIFLGLKQDDFDKLADLFLNIDFVPCLEWTLFFDAKTVDKNNLCDKRIFDMMKPFRLVEACTTGCYDFRGVWVR